MDGSGVFPYYSGTWTGAQAVVDNLLVPLARDWDKFRATAHEFVADGDRVVSFGAYTGTNKRTHKQLMVLFAHRWVVREGKIASFQMYTDTAKVLSITAAK